jgi:hypothetical protein
MALTILNLLTLVPPFAMMAEPAGPRLDWSTLTVAEWAGMSVSQWDRLVIDPSTKRYRVEATALYAAGPQCADLFAAGSRREGLFAAGTRVSAIDGGTL